MFALLLRRGDHPEILVRAREDAKGLLVILPLFAKPDQNGTGAARGPGAGQGQRLQLQQPNITGEDPQSLTGDVVGEERLTQLQRRAHRLAVNGDVLRPGVAPVALPDRAQPGKAAALFQDIGQGLSPGIVAGGRESGWVVAVFHWTRKTVPQTEHTEQTKTRLAKRWQKNRVIKIRGSVVECGSPHRFGARPKTAVTDAFQDAAVTSQPQRGGMR